MQLGDALMHTELDSPYDWKSLFFSSEGRIGRQPFNIILGAVFLLFTFISLALPFSGKVCLLLFALLAMVCPTIKRLHDREYSGVWYAYFLAIIALAFLLIVGPVNMISTYFLVMSYANEASIKMESWNPAHGLAFLVILGLITYLAVVGWFMTELCFFRGTEGPNEYGPEPTEKSLLSS